MTYWAFRLAGLLERIADRLEDWAVYRNYVPPPEREWRLVTGRVVEMRTPDPIVIVDFDE